MNAGLRVRQGDRLRMVHIESAAGVLSARVRVVYDDGTDDDVYMEPVTGTADRTVRTNEGAYVAKRSGYVVGGGVTVGAAVDVRRGQMYVSLSFSGDPSVLLCRGYVFNGHGIVAGEYVEAGPIGGRGFVRQITMADPAAGAEFAAQAVPDNVLWRVLSFTASMAQGITQSPHPALVFQTATGAAVIALVPIGADVASSTTVRCTWSAVIPDTRNNVNGGSMSAAVPDVVLNPTDEVLTSTEGIGANSDYGAGILTVEEWLVL